MGPRRVEGFPLAKNGGPEGTPLPRSEALPGLALHAAHLGPIDASGPACCGVCFSRPARRGRYFHGKGAQAGMQVTQDRPHNNLPLQRKARRMGREGNPFHGSP